MHIFTVLYADHWFSAFAFIIAILFGIFGFIDIFCNSLNLEDEKRRRGNILLAEFLCFYGVTGLLLLPLWNNLYIVFIGGAALAVFFGCLVEFVRIRRSEQIQKAGVH